MVREANLRALYAILLLIGFGPCKSLAAQNQASDTVYHLHGTVVNGQTGQPLARALVASNDRRLAAMTNSEGRFDIEVSVLADQAARLVSRDSSVLAITAQKPGFVPQPQPVTVALDDTLSSTEVTLKLMPAGTITGSVSTSSNDAPQNVRLLLLRRQVQDGNPTWLPNGMHTTNSRGEYRFGNLSPGEYTVLTMEYRPNGSSSERSKQVTQQYPPLYYGDAPNLGSAGKLTLHYGEIARADIHLHLVNYYLVSIAVAAEANTPMNVRAVGTDSFSGFQFSYNSRDGMIEGSLPDGSYTFVISSFGQPQSFARVPLQVAGTPVHAGPIALAPAGTVEVRVHTEFTAQTTDPHPGVQVSLRPDDMFGGYIGGGSRPDHEDDFPLENVQPGRYFVSAHASHGYVAALSSGQTDLLQNPLTVNASGTAPPIDVTLRDDSGTLSGNVRSDDGPLPTHSFVVLLPEEAGGSVVQGFAGADGKFTVENVAPGNYRLLATSRLPIDIPYRDAETMRAYTGKAPTITVTAGESLSADAPLLDSMADSE